MAFQPAPGVALATLRFENNTTGDFIGVNTLYFEKDDETQYVFADLEPLADQLASWWASNMDPITSANCRLNTITVRGLANQVDVQFTGVYNNPGAQSGDLLPYNATIAISFGTGLTGRTQRGRNYICGMVESQQASSIVTTPYAEALLAAYEELPVEVEVVEQHHVVLSRWLNGNKRTNGVAFPVAQYRLVDQVMDSMRKRLPGRGQ